MADRIVPVEAVSDDDPVLFTVREPDGRQEEVILFAADGSIVAWKNFCQHEVDQRLDTGRGPRVRDGGIVCPRHASVFDVATGECDHGPAAGSTLPPVAVEVRAGHVYLTEDDLQFLHLGGSDENDGSPSSSSHLGL